MQYSRFMSEWIPDRYRREESPGGIFALSEKRAEVACEKPLINTKETNATK